MPLSVQFPSVWEKCDGDDAFYDDFTPPSTAYGGIGADVFFGNDAATGGYSYYGGDGGDTLYGGSKGDALYGGSKSDLLYAGAGDDRLYGGKGNDVFAESAGNATITGGEGADEFEIGTTSGAVTRVKDFGKGNDLLVLAELLVGGDLDGATIYNDYGSQNNGHTFFTFDSQVVRIDNYTTTATGWGEDIMTY